MQNHLFAWVIIGSVLAVAYYVILHGFAARPLYRGTVISIAAMPDHRLVVLQAGWSRVWLPITAGSLVLIEKAGMRCRATANDIHEGAALAVWGWSRWDRQGYVSNESLPDRSIREIVILE